MSANEKVKPAWPLRSLKTTAHTLYMSEIRKYVNTLCRRGFKPRLLNVENYEYYLSINQWL